MRVESWVRRLGSGHLRWFRRFVNRAIAFNDLWPANKTFSSTMIRQIGSPEDTPPSQEEVRCRTRENPGIIRALSLGFEEIVVPGPLVSGRRRSERNTLGLEMSKAPSKHGSDAVHRLEVEGYIRRGGRSEPGFWAPLNQ